MMTDYEKYQYMRLQREAEVVKDYTMRQRICYILSSFDFMLYNAGMTSMFIVVTGIQYWCTDYFLIVLDLEQKKAFSLFMFVGAVGPTLGIVCAGLVFDRVGGYLGVNAIPICSTAGLIAMMAGLMAASLDDPYQVAACLTVELFCGGFSMPAVTGIMLNSVPPSMRTMANSIANTSYNLFGYLPAPLLYGIAYEYGGGGKSHLGMWTIQLFTCLTFALNLIAYIRFKLVMRYAREELHELISSKPSSPRLDERPARPMSTGPISIVDDWLTSPGLTMPTTRASLRSEGR